MSVNSVNAIINKEEISSENELNVHYIPATIDGDGPIKIHEYFNSYTKEDKGVLTNALRGHPIMGSELKLPENFIGVVLRETEKKLTDENVERVLKFSGHFSKFTYWNYDKVPSQNDGYQKALQWLNISDSLHSKIDSLEDINQ